MADPADKAPKPVTEQPAELLTDEEAGEIAGGMLAGSGTSSIKLNDLATAGRVTGVNQIGPVARPDPPTGPPTGPKLV